MATTAYQIIKAKADQVGWPVAYRTDLTVHDLNMLRSKPQQFIWILRECGTWLFVKESLQTTVGQAWFDAIKKSSVSEGALFFAYFDGRLVLIDHSRAAEFLRNPSPILDQYAVPENLRLAMERTARTSCQLGLSLA